MAKLRKLGSVSVATETNFGDPSGLSYTALQVAEPVDLNGLNYEAIPHDFVRASIYRNARILGARTGTITIKSHLYGLKSSVPSAASDYTSANDMPLFNLIAACMGNGVQGGYESSESSSTTSSLAATGIATSMASPGEGGAVAWQTTDYGYQVGWIKDLDTDAAALFQTAIAVPTGSKIYGSKTAFTTDAYDYFGSGGGDPKAFSIKIAGHDSSDVIRCNGCRPYNLRITGEAGQPVSVEIDIWVSHWEELGSGGAPSPVVYTNPDPEPLLNAWLAVGDDVSYANLLTVNGFSLDLGMTSVQVGDINQMSGVGSYVVTDRNPQLTVTVDRNYGEQPADFRDQTEKKLSFFFGTQPGKMFAMCMPACRVVEFPGYGDTEGRLTTDVIYEAHYYAGDTGSGDGGSAASTSNAINKMFKIAFL